MAKKLFLLDAMALIYRAYYALNRNPRINSKGLNTSAILGFANTLYDVLKNEQPTHIGVAFDTMAPTVRHEEFDQYKANRESMPEDLAASLPYIVRLIEAFNIPILLKDGYEADDVIGTLAKEAENQGFTVYMMTPDKDFGQLVSNKVYIFKPGKFGEPPTIMGVREVCEKFGVDTPRQVIDILGLAGDASDNIPGIPGVGEVTARKLIGEFGSIENVIQNSDKIANDKLREKVNNNVNQALISKQLATIILDVPIRFDPESLKTEPPDRESLTQLLEELEFTAFARRVFADLAQIKIQQPVPSIPGIQGNLFETTGESNMPESSFLTLQSVKPTYHKVETLVQRRHLIEHLRKKRAFCFDTETTGLDTYEAELVSLTFATDPHEAYCVILPHSFAEASSVLKEFMSLFQDPSIEKTGQNLKFDISMLQKYGIEVEGTLFDTMLAHYLLQPEMRHSLDFMAKAYLNYQKMPIEALIGRRGKRQGNMRDLDTNLLVDYACEDADITLQLRKVLEPGLKENECLDLFRHIEIPLIKVLASMEQEGVKIDIPALKEYSAQLQLEILETERHIFEQAGMMFNIASPKQLGEVLFDRMKIAPKPRQTKSQQHSTAEDVLSRMVSAHPIVQQILDYRSLTKLKSTYVDVLPAMVSTRTGRLHTSFNQAVTSTGRLSSNRPNLQNIPVRTDKGREIRKAFIPRNDDYVMLSADYSQIELRIIASLSGDTNMIDDFMQLHDIHSATASRIYNIPLADVTRDMRRNAKTVNFGIIYGISAFGLSERLSISRKEAADIIGQYFTKYPGIRKYMEQQIDFARRHNYVETIMKRRRYLRDIHSNNSNLRGFAERNAINAPIQGSAADMIKMAMIAIYQELKRLNLRSRMTLQVHDELVFDVHRDEMEEVKRIVSEKMRGALTLNVPVEVEMSAGKNWLEAH